MAVEKNTSEVPNDYLELSECRLTFEATSKSKLTNVFYDESNTQVFSIHSGDVTEVIVKSPNEEFCRNFKMKEKGHVICIKFSPDMNILSVQRTNTSVDFLVFTDGKITNEFSHTFKSNIMVLDFMWSGKTEIIFVTKQGIRLCKVDAGAVKPLDTLNESVNWFNYFSPICLLLVNCGSSGGSMQLLQMKQNKILKLAKFELDVDGMSKTTKSSVSDRDVVLGVVYNLPRILIMNYQNLGSSLQAELIIYTIIELSCVKKTHILKIDQSGCDQSGRFALNLVDNLIIVHNQISKTSMVFDITEAEYDGVSYHDPIAEPKSIKPMNKKSMEDSPDPTNQPKICELYSRNWVTFQPNIIVDAKIGCLWYIELNLFGFLRSITDKSKLTSFLLLRTDSKSVIAQMLEEIMDGGDRNMEELGDIFNQINCVYRNYLDITTRSQMGLPPSMTKMEDDGIVVSFKTVIDPEYMNNYVFSKLVDKLIGKGWKESRFLTWVMLEYIRSLEDCLIPVQHFLYELLINSLVRNGNYYQLHQLLQYHAISDSKPLACLLLSLENLYPAASQLAIDMFERLGTAKDEITEILISKQQLISSLRYVKKNCPNHTTAPDERMLGTKYVAAAQAMCNEKLFYTFLKYFNKEGELRKFDWS